MMMVPNPITEEIREIRHRLAAQFDNDVFRIGAETRRRQATKRGSHEKGTQLEWHGNFPKSCRARMI